MFPTADVIATAIYAAARELAPPGKVNEITLHSHEGRKDVGARVGYGGGFPLARTRTYAAAALWRAFPEANRISIARCVGQGYADVWAPTMDKNLKAGALTWWNAEVFERVGAAIVWAKENPAPM